MEGRLDYITGSNSLGYASPANLVEVLWRCFINLKPKGIMFFRELVTVHGGTKMGDASTGW